MNKDLLERFGKKLDRRFSKVYDNQSMLDWVCANTTLDGRPFSTEGYEFQDAIMNDMHPSMSVIKCSQIGLTEIQIRKALGFITRNRGVSCIFSLPTELLYRRVSQTRVQPLVSRNKVFNKEQDEDSVRSMSIIQVENSFLYLTACTESDATSTAADAVFNDEIDLSDQKMLALFNSRLLNSDWHISQGFSTPTFQSHGIDADYKASDQRKYLQRCTSCNHWNWPQFNTKFCMFPDMPSSVEDLLELNQEIVNEMDLSKCYVACEKCHAKLDGPREWVATYPGRTAKRGYWVTPFSTDRRTLSSIVDELLKYKKRDYLQGFHNTVLGETYSNANTQITLEAIESAMKKGTPNYGELPHDVPLAIGLDMGQTTHLVVGNANGKEIYLFEPIPVGKIVERIKNLKANYNIVAGCVDRLPYTPTAEEIMRITNAIIIPMQYQTGKDSDMKLVLDEFEQLSHASMNRTKILDEVAAQARNYEWAFSGYGHQKEILTQHLRNMVRVEEPEKPAVWTKIDPSDHYFHALGLYLAALKFRPLVVEYMLGDVGISADISVATVTSHSGIAGLPGTGTSKSRLDQYVHRPGFQ